MESEETDPLTQLICQIYQNHPEVTNNKIKQFYFNKLPLRALAFNKGLTDVCNLNKKATQFGTGIEKKFNKGIFYKNSLEALQREKDS
jgi:hypothetical protein